MRIDWVVAEIGSTTTLVNAFSKTKGLLGKGMAATTVESDVNTGLLNALEALKKHLKTDMLTYDSMFASSSAAGGLKMTVSGLVYEMTVKAAKQAATNAGANIHKVSAGDLTNDDLEQIQSINPNIILVSGGTDFGEKEVAHKNIKKIESLSLNVPIIYAGNVDNHYRINKYFENSAQKEYLTIVDNVYPRVDQMNIHPVRKQIYETFEKHIIHAKGMQNIKNLVDGSIMPTPGSVMESTIVLEEILGNVMTIDVGGATTDIHSITTPSEEFEDYQEGEPKEKRTVEGDLGVFINYKKVIESIGKQALAKKLNISNDALENLIENYQYKPKTQIERDLVYELTKHCVFTALDRHVGDYRNVYTTSGQKVIPQGRDLTQLQAVVLTGGALINLKSTEAIIKSYFKTHPNKMIPKTIKVYKDNDYIMSSVGVLSIKHLDFSKGVLITSLNIDKLN